MKGVREDKGRWPGQEWNAQIPESKRESLAYELKVQPELLARLNHVTKFEDHQFPQASEGDIYFEPDFDLGWMGGALGVGLIGGYVLWRRRKVPSPSTVGK